MLLCACTQALLDLPHTDPVEVLGDIDALKLRSSMTLFARAVPAEPAFTAVLDQYFAGEPDPVTLDLLSC